MNIGYYRVNIHQHRRHCVAAASVVLAVALICPKALCEVFTIAVIPDTQIYCDTNKPQPASAQVFSDETQYIAEQKAAQNIVFAAHVGDVVQHGASAEEWMLASNAMNLIANTGLPFGVVPGNHDYAVFDNATRLVSGAVQWNRCFGSNSAFYAGKNWYGGSWDGGLDSWQIFKADGKDFLHIGLDLNPSDEALAWAAGVVTNHPGMPVILTTHSYLSWESNNGMASRNNRASRSGGSVNTGQAIWDKLIFPNERIFLVLCGHDFSPTDSHGVSKGESMRVETNAAGRPVYQILTDYQGNTYDASGKAGVYPGGAGWLRLMTFDTEKRTIHFRTYSVELKRFAGIDGTADFGLPNNLSDFTLAIPDWVLKP